MRWTSDDSNDSVVGGLKMLKFKVAESIVQVSFDINVDLALKSDFALLTNVPRLSMFSYVHISIFTSNFKH